MPLRNILLASFIPETRVEWFYGYMEGKHNIKSKQIFKYKQLVNPDVWILTFRYQVDTDVRVNFKELFPNAMLIHKKGNALYTINGLNKLIDSMTTDMVGNVEHSDVVINWSDYQNKIIMVDDDNLSINDIEFTF